jgi:hypothetical protein
MSTTQADSEAHQEPGLYEIRLKGHLDDRWTAWFDGLTITREDNGETRLTGPVVDQAALHGLLRKVRDLGLPLIAVIQIDPKQANEPHANANADTNHTYSTQETNA